MMPHLYGLWVFSGVSIKIFQGYPVEKINPLEVYKKEFPLVKRYNKIASLMDEILAKITYSFSRVPKRTPIPKNLLYDLSNSIRNSID